VGGPKPTKELTLVKNEDVVSVISSWDKKKARCGRSAGDGGEGGGKFKSILVEKVKERRGEGQFLTSRLSKKKNRLRHFCGERLRGRREKGLREDLGSLTSFYFSKRKVSE